MGVKVIKTIQTYPKFERTNLQYEVEYDYERSECTCNAYERGDYCRCTTIDHAWVESIDVKEVISKLYMKYCKEHSEINAYCFDRICSIFKVYDKDYYEIESCYGYYGEEIGGIYFSNEKKIVEAFNEVLARDSDIEKIKYVLELEYSYLLERVKNKTIARIEMVNIDSIVLPQQEYFIKLDREVIEDYKNRDLPIAVCLNEKDSYCDKYILIDGYHRFVANKDQKMMVIVVLE
jgi:hypothetical protein